MALSVAESMTVATGLTAVRVAVERFRGGLVVNQSDIIRNPLNLAAGTATYTYDGQVYPLPNGRDTRVWTPSGIMPYGQALDSGLLPPPDGPDQLAHTTVAQAGGEVAKVITAGALVTLGLLVVERGAPELARGLAIVVLVTSALVHGVRLAEIAISATT